MKKLMMIQLLLGIGTLGSIGADAGTSRVETFSYRGRTTQVDLERSGRRDYYQNDILFDAAKVRARLQALESGTSRTNGGGTGTVGSGLAAVLANELWPNATIPFEIDPRIPNQFRITDAIAHWNATTPVRLVPRTTQADFVRFTWSSDRCASWVGRDGGSQDIDLADGCDTGAVIHEIGHAAGIFHEQSREDRDEHVIVHWGNIETGKGHNFKKYSESDFLFWGDRDGRDVGPYDFSSIMHYGSDFFSSNGQPTLTRRYGCTGLECLITPNRSALSALDRMYIHEIYCPMLNWDSNRCRNYYSSGGSFAYRISARTGGAGGEERCLDIAGGSRENQAKVNGFACHTGENQLYYVELRTDGAFTIRNRHSGLCLDVPGGSTGYVEMQQYACHGGANQKFRLYGGGGSLAADDKHGQMQIRTQVGDKCLGFDWQNKLVTTDCTSARARSFKFIARDVPNQYFRISNEQSQECLDIPWGTSDVTWLQTHGCHASDNQKWRFLPRADDSFVIESKKSAKCLSASGMRIEQNLCGTPDQSIAPKNFYAHLLPTGGFELRTKTFPRLCVTYDGVGRISVAGCGGHRTQRWAVQR